MEVKARLHDTSFGADGKMRVTFTLERRQDLSALEEKDIRLKAVAWREKRSLDANAFFHVLVGKIAEVTRQSRTEAHNSLIADYGQMEKTDFGLMTIIMDNEIDWRKVEGIHLRPTGKIKTMDNGRDFQVYIVMRGSHTYDTKEMSTLIDGAVSEADALGIETITPDQKAEMMQRWNIAS